jgi:hypothetical protein
MTHRIGDTYCVKNAGKIGDEGWRMAYYPILPISGEPRALMEKAIYEEKVVLIAGREFCRFKVDAGTDFREVPLRFMSKENDELKDAGPVTPDSSEAQSRHSVQ